MRRSRKTAGIKERAIIPPITSFLRVHVIVAKPIIIEASGGSYPSVSDKDAFRKLNLAVITSR